MLLYAAEQYEPTIAVFEPLTSHVIVHMYARMYRKMYCVCTCNSSFICGMFGQFGMKVQLQSKFTVEECILPKYRDKAAAKAAKKSTASADDAAVEENAAL